VTDRIGSIDFERLQRQQLAFDAFRAGSTLKQACNDNGVELHEVESLIRLRMEENVRDLAGWIGEQLERTLPAELQKIEDWLRTTMIWVGIDQDGLEALPGVAGSAIKFPSKS